jgi:hypothetical protein
VKLSDTYVLQTAVNQFPTRHSVNEVDIIFIMKLLNDPTKLSKMSLQGVELSSPFIDINHMVESVGYGR